MRTARLPRLGYALLLLLGLGTGQLSAQAAPPAAQTFAERVVATERELVEHEPSLQHFHPQKRKALIEFVIGQASCKGDFFFAQWSWDTVLKPHLRAPDQPKQKIELTYGEAEGKLAVYARTFRDIKFLETLAEHIGERYAWPRPFAMEMVTCGEGGANWHSGKLKICYEMAQDFAELYRDYAHKLKIFEVAAGKKRR